MAIVNDLESGHIDADLGDDVFKRRLARAGEGKSGGFRMILFFRRGERAIFIYGFLKSDRENIREDELKGFRDLSKVMLGYSDTELETLVDAGVLIEIRENEQDIQD